MSKYVYKILQKYGDKWVEIKESENYREMINLYHRDYRGWNYILVQEEKENKND